MSSALGDLVVSLNCNTAPFSSALQVANQTLVKFDNAVGSVMDNIAKPFRQMASVVGEAGQQLANLLNPINWASKGFNLLMFPLQQCARQFEGILDAGKAVEAFTKVENASVRLSMAVRNAGGDVGLSNQRIGELTRGRAGGITGMGTLVEAGVKGGNLEAAFKASKDLAGMMGSDLPSAANLMANAMQFPERAARSLREAHVRLDAEQQAHIKTLMAMGDQQGAQAIILAAISEKTDGFATAMRGTLSGAMKEYSGALERISEIMGEAIKPIMLDVIALFKDMADWVISNKETFIAWGQTAGNAFAGVTEPLRNLIALLRAGETESAFDYVKLLWQELQDRFGDGITFIERAFRALGETLVKIWPPVWKAIEIGAAEAAGKIAAAVFDAAKSAVVNVLPGGEIKRGGYAYDQMIAHTNAKMIADAKAAAGSGLSMGSLTEGLGGDSAATKALREKYNASAGAQRLEDLKARADNQRQMDSALSDTMKKHQVDIAAAAGQKANDAELLKQLATDSEMRNWKPPRGKHESLTQTAALEKGTNEAWQNILAAQQALKGKDPQEQLVDKAEETNRLLQQIVDKPAITEEGFAP